MQVFMVLLRFCVRCHPGFLKRFWKAGSVVAGERELLIFCRPVLFFCKLCKRCNYDKLLKSKSHFHPFDRQEKIYQNASGFRIQPHILLEQRILSAHSCFPRRKLGSRFGRYPHKKAFFPPSRATLSLVSGGGNLIRGRKSRGSCRHPQTDRTPFFRNLHLASSLIWGERKFGQELLA